MKTLSINDFSAQQSHHYDDDAIITAASIVDESHKSKREKCQAVVVMNLSPIPYRYVVAAQNDKRVFGLGHTITLTVFLFFRAIVELVKRKKEKMKIEREMRNGN